jgi:cytochrome c biogenesis protein CcmG, thiol:disulfide interchange protein DsbE
MFTPDALVLGKLVLEWGRLAFLIGVMVFLTVLGRGKDKDAKLERVGTIAVILAVVAARLGFVFEQREAFATGNLLEIFDVRSGGFSWPWALMGLVPFAWLRTPAQFGKLASATVIAVIAAALPFLFKPTSSSVNVQNDLGLTSLEGKASTWGDLLAPTPAPNGLGALEKPVLVNVWATWCGPCRAEMPLLAEYAKRGAKIVFLNAGESADDVRHYLASEKLEVPVMLDTGGVRDQLRVVGLPTTFIVGKDGQILERHMGPLDRGGLEMMLAQTDWGTSKP